MDTNRFKLTDRTEHLHSRAGLLSLRLLQRLGEHHGIGAECVSEWESVANADGNTNTDRNRNPDSNADGNCNSYPYGNRNSNTERYCETQSDGEATSHTSASPIGQFYSDVGETESVRWYQTAFGQHLVAA